MPGCRSALVPAVPGDCKAPDPDRAAQRPRQCHGSGVVARGGGCAGSYLASFPIVCVPGRTGSQTGCEQGGQIAGHRPDICWQAGTLGGRRGPCHRHRHPVPGRQPSTRQRRAALSSAGRAGLRAREDPGKTKGGASSAESMMDAVRTSNTVPAVTPIRCHVAVAADVWSCHAGGPPGMVGIRAGCTQGVRDDAATGSRARGYRRGRGD